MEKVGTSLFISCADIISSAGIGSVILPILTTRWRTVSISCHSTGSTVPCFHPNALMTLMEYLQDYASPKTKEIGMKLIEKELDNIPSEKVRRIAEEHLRDIENGQRDFRF